AFRAQFGLGTKAETAQLIKSGQPVGNLQDILNAFPEGDSGVDTPYSHNYDCAGMATAVCHRLDQLGLQSGTVAIAGQTRAYDVKDDGGVEWKKGTDGQPQYKQGYHAINYIVMPNGKYAFYDPQTDTFGDNNGAGYTKVNEALSSQDF